MKKIENLWENICFYDGVFMPVAIIFLIRNISVLLGVYIPFSGNIEMRFTEVEIWRYVFFVLYSAITILIFTKIHKKEIPSKEKFNKYYSAFLWGAAMTFGFEFIFHFLGYRLGSTGILF